MATSQPMQFPQPYEVVFRTLTEILPSQCKMQIRRADGATGIIEAASSAGMLTWGENLVIRVGASGDAATVVQIDSSLKFGLVAWGKHQKNFDAVFGALSSRLGVAPTPLPPTPPPAAPSGSATG
jgi:hypothetical protein